MSVWNDEAAPLRFLSRVWSAALSKTIRVERKDSPYRSGRSPDWLKSKNSACEAVRRDAEEDWGRERWRRPARTAS
jgi:hypothetical protein